jgi:hypothetical protein
MRDEVTDRPARFIRISRIRRRPRNIVSAVRIDDVVDVDRFGPSRFDDQLATKECRQADIEVRTSHRGEYRRLRRLGGTELEVLRIDGERQQVVTNVIHTQSDMPRREKGGQPIDGKLARGRRVQRQNQQDYGKAEADGYRPESTGDLPRSTWSALRFEGRLH